MRPHTLSLAAQEPPPTEGLPPQAIAVYLALAVTLLLLLLLFVVIALNVARRLARRREALRRLHQPTRAIPPESAWAAAGKRASPLPESDPPAHGPDDTNPDDNGGDQSSPWDDHGDDAPPLAGAP